MIVAGFGFRSAVTEDSLKDALELAGKAATVDALATAVDKAQSGAFQGFANALGLEVHLIDAETLSRQDTLTQSPASHKARATGSLAEAAALAAIGPNGRLIGPRIVSRDGMATCALAEGDKG